MLFKFGLVAALLGALLALAVQNPQPVLLNFLGWRGLAASALTLVLAGALAGLVCGFFLGWAPRRGDDDGEGGEPPPRDPPA